MDRQEVAVLDKRERWPILARLGGYGVRALKFIIRLPYRSSKLWTFYLS